MTRAPRSLVTGATRGIGRAIAAGLVAAGHEVVGTGRRLEDARAVGADVGFEGRALDLADPDGVRAFAQAWAGPLDALVNDAAVALDGFDADVARRTLAVNYHGTAALTDHLLPALAEGARVVHVSSGLGSLSGFAPALRDAFFDPALDRAGLDALAARFVDDVAAGRHRAAGWPTSAYGVSKACLNAHARLLARALADDPRGVAVFAACPGWVRTDMGGPSAPRSPEEGADTPLWLALEAPRRGTGRFYRDRRPIPW